MKKIISIILAALMLVTLCACGEKKNVETAAGVNTSAPSEENAPAAEEEKTDVEANTEGKAEDKEDEEKPKESDKPAQKPTEKPAEKPEKSPEVKPSEKPQAKPTEKPEAKPTAKPEAKPSEKPQAKPTEKPEVKPEKTPEVKPSEKPAEKPAETPQNVTLGQTLLADFKSKASSGSDVLTIAEALVTNEAILFSGGAMPVEEGYLSGFDNYEVKGFKSGAVFMPMIGSIPFVGYVFELKDSTDAGSFVQSLRDNANLRWNICVSADEMVTGSVGNKVFFVMCPTSLSE